MTTEVLLGFIIENVTADYDHYGLPVFEIDGEDLAIASSHEEAEEAARQYIEQSVWAFNADFLACHIEELDSEDIDRLRGDRCEDCNDALVKLIDDFDYFVTEAIAADGIGHFLSTYDGEVEEIGDFRVVRIN